ncbi:head maturation protease [Pseudomonas phage WP1]
MPGARVLDGRSLTISVLISDHPMRVMKWVSRKPSRRLLSSAQDKLPDSAVEELRALAEAPATCPEVPGRRGAGAGAPGRRSCSGRTDRQRAHDRASDLEGAQEDDEEHEEAPSAVDPAMAAVDPEHQEGAASEMSGEGEVAELISQVKAVLARLEGTVAEEADEEHDKGQDVVEGLEEQSILSGAQTASDNGGEGKDNSEELPEMAQKNAQDPAIHGLYRDTAAKDRLYKRLSSNGWCVRSPSHGLG